MLGWFWLGIVEYFASSGREASAFGAEGEDFLLLLLDPAPHLLQLSREEKMYRQNIHLSTARLFFLLAVLNSLLGATKVPFARSGKD